MLKFANFLKQKGFEKISILGYCWGTSLFIPAAPPFSFRRYPHVRTQVLMLAPLAGGKLTLLALSSTLSSPTPFDVGAIVHPAMLVPEDGDNLAAPLGFFPSMDEPKETVVKIHEAMEKKEYADRCDYKLYDTV